MTRAELGLRAAARIMAPTHPREAALIEAAAAVPGRPVRCSGCRRLGHNARTCPVVEERELRAIIAERRRAEAEEIYRVVVWRTAHDELSASEIADALGITERHVHRLRARARREGRL